LSKWRTQAARSSNGGATTIDHDRQGHADAAIDKAEFAHFTSEFGAIFDLAARNLCISTNILTDVRFCCGFG